MDGLLGDQYLDVAINGAGPYGLSLAAHLKKAGVGYRLFGSPVGFWRDHMPEVMLLKSDGFASNLDYPEKAFPLSRFCQERDIPHDDERIPVKLDTFMDAALREEVACINRTPIPSRKRALRQLMRSILWQPRPSAEAIR
jgi:cation diffusion facilitator CzcD-associated flavoprotein CzcO